MTVAGLYTFQDDEMDHELVKAQIASFVSTPNQKRSRQIIVQGVSALDRPYWKDDEKFSIENHFRVVNLKDTSKKELLEQVSIIHSSEFDKSKPRWEAVWLQGGRKPAMLLRAHHSISDGQGFVRGLLTFVASLDPNVDIASLQYSAGRAVTESKIDAEKSSNNKSAKAANNNSQKKKPSTFQNFFLYCMKIFFFIYGTYLALKNFLKLLFFRRKSMQKNQISRSKQVGWSTEVSLDSVKLVKNVFGVSVNDVLVSALAGALETFLISKKELKDNSFWFMIPTSLRNPADWSVSNQSTVYCLNIPIAGSDHKKRLGSLNKKMKSLKSSSEPIWANIFQSLSMRYPNLVPQLALDYSIGKNFAAVVTNVPGPAENIKWAGKKIEEIVALIPQAYSNSLGCAIYTYAGKVTISIMMDEILNDSCFDKGAAQEIAELFDSNFNEMLEMALAKKVNGDEIKSHIKSD
ncbi:hypothetical protein HK099_004715 [Clydaea vesicula]|uniref:Diacylglycerol O-acyltransferase n=1 Tax=Clydaea vesicula TaxID=447962 RepID=A0AAD5U2P3_9FUNG|nr:hypothetical protein HK099_004715 [Clydaea vesicula]